MLIKLVAAIFVLLISAQSAHADAVGLSWYTYHGDTGPDYKLPEGDPWYGKDKLRNNNTRGLYYVKNSGTPVLGDNVIVGYYCNSFSRPERNNYVDQNGKHWYMEVPESACNVTLHAGKIFTLAGDRKPGMSWDVSASVELFGGYKQHADKFGSRIMVLPVRVNSKYLQMSAFVAPTLSARFGYTRLAIVGKKAVHLSFEYNY